MLHFYAPETSENQKFSDVFRGYRNGALGYNGLKIRVQEELPSLHGHYDTKKQIND